MVPEFKKFQGEMLQLFGTLVTTCIEKKNLNNGSEPG